MTAPTAPKLTAFDIGCVVVSGIVGVGIFFTPQRVAAAVDGPLQMVTAWGIGGVIALCGALVFAELSRLVPGYGGTFVYIERAFGPLPAFLYGWANWLIIQAGALAVVGLVMVDHLDVALYGEAKADPGRAVTITLATIGAFTVVNALGLHVGKRVQNAFSVLKMAAIFGLVALGLFVGESHPGATRSSHEPHGWVAALGQAMLLVLFSYGGWQQGAFVAGAARRPLRDVPLGIAAGVLVVVLAYVSINLTYLNLLGFDAAGQTPTIAADACRAALAPLGAGDLGARVMAAAITVSALGIMNTILLAPPWVLHAMAQRGLFLRACGHVHPRFGSPIVGVVAQGTWAMAMLVVTYFGFGRSTQDTLGFLLTGVVFVDWLFYALCGLTLVALARRPDARLVWRISPAVAVLFTLFAALVMLGAIVTQPLPSALGAGLCALGLVPFAFFDRRR
ncbi:MAG: APC family permease [Planctomycetota bacterium]